MRYGAAVRFFVSLLDCASATIFLACALTPFAQRPARLLAVRRSFRAFHERAFPPTISGFEMRAFTQRARVDSGHDG